MNDHEIDESYKIPFNADNAMILQEILNGTDDYLYTQIKSKLSHLNDKQKTFIQYYISKKIMEITYKTIKNEK